MTRPVRSWWRRRSLTLRVTLAATLVLALGLICGTAGLATLFYHNRIESLDSNVKAESSTIVALVRSGQMPNPLPVPADRPLFAQVVGVDGMVRAASPSASRVVPILPLSVLQARADSGPFSTMETALSTAPMRVAVTSTRLGGNQVFVVSAVSSTDVSAVLDALLRILLIAIPLILLAAAIATWLAVDSALRPVDELAAAAGQVAGAPGPTAPVLPVPPSGDEIERLAHTLNRMLERLHSATEQQRTFVADAAHELRSPIAAIRAQLEVALTTSTESAEWRRVGSGVIEDVDRISRLADDMLLLARLDSGGTARRELVDVSALLGLEGGPHWVSGDARALHRALDNVTSNARRHARKRVQVAVTRSGPSLVVTVDDDGPGIPAADRVRVFDRWLRLDEGRARDAGGAGLGLAITRSVVLAHGGAVALSESAWGGVRVTIRLPGAERG